MAAMSSMMAREPYQLSVISTAATSAMADTASPAMTNRTGHARSTRGTRGIDFPIFFQCVASIRLFMPERHPWRKAAIGVFFLYR
jgi:hypothetical protein